MSRGERALTQKVEQRIDARHIRLECLVLPDKPVRTREGAPDVADLARSIKASGIIEPIVVRPAGQSCYEVVAGERRALAARSLEMTNVPCIVRECSDEEAVVIGIVENLQRAELNPMDRARGISRLCAFGRSQEEIGEALGIAQSSVAHHLRLLSLPRAVAALIEQGRLSMGHGKILAALAPADAAELADDCVAQAISVRDLERRVGRSNGHAHRTPTPSQSTSDATPSQSTSDAKALREEHELSNGVYVIVKTTAGMPESGTIEIPYYSEGEKVWTLSVLAGTT